MFNEPVRILAAWLAHATLGVNAKLATVPRDGGDPLPTSVTIVDETTNGSLARGRLPETPRPILTVEIYRWDALEPVPSQGVLRDFDVTLLIRFGDTEAQSETGKRDAHYTMRAVQMSLAELWKESNSASRTRNNVQLYDCTRITPLTLYAETPNAEIVGGHLITVRGRDIQPY